MKSKASGIKYIVYIDGTVYSKGLPKTYVKSIRSNRIIEFLLESALSRTAIDKVVEQDEDDVLVELDNDSMPMKREPEMIQICAHKYIPFRFRNEDGGMVLCEVQCVRCGIVAPPVFS